jgi:hypothetical protein
MVKALVLVVAICIIIMIRGDGSGRYFTLCLVSFRDDVPPFVTGLCICGT